MSIFYIDNIGESKYDRYIETSYIIIRISFISKKNSWKPNMKYQMPFDIDKSNLSTYQYLDIAKLLIDRSIYLIIEQIYHYFPHTSIHGQGFYLF